MGEQQLSFTFTVDEINVVLGALGAQPFTQVAGLISNIKQQAEVQLKQPEEPKE